MHKTHHLRSGNSASASAVLPPKKRQNRKRRNWNKIIRRICGVALLVDLGLLVFANPHLQVTNVQIHGLQTLPPAQVFAEARVPARTNILWMALRRPFAARLVKDPVIAQVTTTYRWPHTLVLTVTERQPFAALAVADAQGGQAYWLLDRQGVPYRALPTPPTGVPLLEWEGAPPTGWRPGVALHDARLADAYTLLGLVRDAKNLAILKIKVDQNADLCLNSRDNLQIKLGQPDALPQKIALACATVDWHDGELARRAAVIDVSCPQQPVWTPRVSTGPGTATESDTGLNAYGP